MSNSEPQQCAKSTGEVSVDDVLLIDSANTLLSKSNDRKDLEKPCLPNVTDDSPFLNTKSTKRKYVLHSEAPLSLQNGSKRKGSVVQTSSSENVSECVKNKKKMCLSAALCDSTCERPVKDDSDEKFLTCPVCCQKVTHNLSSHMKRCAEKHQVTLAQVLDGLELFQKYSREREALGLPKTSVGLSRRKSISSKNPVSKKIVDPELELGLALSESMRDADEKCLIEQDEILMEAGLGHEVLDRQARLLEKYRFQRTRPVLQKSKPPRLRPGKVASDVPALLTRSDEDRHRLISEKVVAILSCGENVEVGSSKEKSKGVYHKLRSELLLTLVADGSELWLKASHDPQNENNCEVYYVPTLSKFISPSNIKLGMRLKHLSQVPCRILSQKYSSSQTSNAAVLEEIQSCSEKSPKPSSLINEHCNSDFHETGLEMLDIPSPELSKHIILEGVKNSPRMLTKPSSLANESPHKINGSLIHSFQNQSSEVIKRLCYDWKSMLNNHERSDVIVKGDGYEIYCHEFVLYVRCPTILDEIVHQNYQKFIYWTSFTHESVKAFLHYIYCGDTSSLSRLSHKSINEVWFMSKKYLLQELENISSTLSSTIKVEEHNNCYKFSSDFNSECEKSLNQNLQMKGNPLIEKSFSKEETIESVHSIPIALTDEVDEPNGCHIFLSDSSPECAKNLTKNLHITSDIISEKSTVKKEEMESVSKVSNDCACAVELTSSSPDPFSECDVVEESPCKSNYRSNSLSLAGSPKSEKITCDVPCNKRSSCDEYDDKHNTSNCDTLENLSKCRKKLFEVKVNNLGVETIVKTNKSPVPDFPNETVFFDNFASGSVIHTEDKIAVSSVPSLVNSDSSSSSIICLADNKISPEEVVGKQDSCPININESCSSMHKMLEDSFLEDFGRSSLLNSPLNSKLTPKNLKEMASHHSFLSSSEANVTPMPNYNDMDTPKLQKELGKYGIKRLKRKHAESMLKHIYEKLHPVCETDCVKQIESIFIDQENPSLSITKCFTSVNIEKHIPDSSEEEEEEEEEVYNSLKQINLETCKTPAQERILNNLIELELNAQSGENSIELQQSTCDQLWNFITSSPDLYQKILLYDPILIEEFQSALKAQTSRSNLNHVMEFLDKQGITFQTKQYNRRKQRKK